MGVAVVVVVLVVIWYVVVVTAPLSLTITDRLPHSLNTPHFPPGQSAPSTEGGLPPTWWGGPMGGQARGWGVRTQLTPLRSALRPQTQHWFDYLVNIAIIVTGWYLTFWQLQILFWHFYLHQLASLGCQRTSVINWLSQPSFYWFVSPGQTRSGSQRYWSGLACNFLMCRIWDELWYEDSLWYKLKTRTVYFNFVFTNIRYIKIKYDY